MKFAVFAMFAVLIVIIGAALLWPNPSTPSTDRHNSIDQRQPTKDEESGTPLLIIGQKDAPVTVVEYGDFKCPNCARFHLQTGQGIRQDYVSKDEVRIVFRNIALIGPDSERAAQGAYCANDQDKFTEYHDTVYEYMWDNYYRDGNYQAEFDDILTADLLGDLAKDQGMNLKKFLSCLSSGRYKSATQADLDSAQADGVRGTPSFIIGEEKIVGPQPYSVFQTLIDLQLQ